MTKLIKDIENKNPAIIELITCYLTNYYANIVFIDAINKIEDYSAINNHLQILKKNIIEICNIINNPNNNEIEDVMKRIGKLLACRNVLRKYNQYDLEFIRESNKLGDVLGELDWNNINEKYEKIREVINEYIDESIRDCL